jgi:hypothetical protein
MCSLFVRLALARIGRSPLAEVVEVDRNWSYVKPATENTE